MKASLSFLSLVATTLLRDMYPFTVTIFLPSFPLQPPRVFKHAGTDLETSVEYHIIIYGYDVPYSEALVMSKLHRLSDHRSHLCDEFFNKIVMNPKLHNNKLHGLLPYNLSVISSLGIREISLYLYVKRTDSKTPL